MHRDQIQPAVIDAGSGRDKRPVAILVRSRDSDEEDIHGLAASVNRDDAAFRPALKKSRERGAGIGGKAAAGQTIEALADVGIQTEPHRIKKRPAVDGAGIDMNDA